LATAANYPPAVQKGEEDPQVQTRYRGGDRPGDQLEALSLRGGQKLEERSWRGNGTKEMM
jgi:hypothetical protein